MAPSPLRLTLLLLAIGAAVVVPTCGGCSEQPEPTPAPAPGTGPADPLLVVDGLTITFGDVAPALAFFDGLSPTESKRAKMRRILEEYLVPLRCAERDFAALRPLQLAQAEALCNVAGNVFELDEHSRNLTRRRAELTTRDLEIPIAMFLFDRQNLGARSQPIPLPQGYIVAGAFDIEENPLVLLDRCDALQVAFHTHDAKTWRAWLAELQQRLAAKTTFFHPDYRDAMPSWLELP